MNQNSLLGADHHQAVSVLKVAGNDVTMVVGRQTFASKETKEEEEKPMENNLSKSMEIRGEVREDNSLLHCEVLTADIYIMPLKCKLKTKQSCFCNLSINGFTQGSVRC